LNQLVDFHEIQQGGHAIEDEPEAIFFQSYSFNHFERVEVQTSEGDAKPTQPALDYHGLSLLPW
jgi:hypothetical protein